MQTANPKWSASTLILHITQLRAQTAPSGSRFSGPKAHTTQLTSPICNLVAALLGSSGIVRFLKQLYLPLGCDKVESGREATYYMFPFEFCQDACIGNIALDRLRRERKAKIDLSVRSYCSLGAQPETLDSTAIEDLEDR